MVHTKKTILITRNKKYKKKPLDPTPWEELSKNIKQIDISKIQTEEEEQKNKSQFQDSDISESIDSINKLSGIRTDAIQPEEVLPTKFNEPKNDEIEIESDSLNTNGQETAPPIKKLSRNDRKKKKKKILREQVMQLKEKTPELSSIPNKKLKASILLEIKIKSLKVKKLRVMTKESRALKKKLSELNTNEQSDSLIQTQIKKIAGKKRLIKKEIMKLNKEISELRTPISNDSKETDASIPSNAKKLSKTKSLESKRLDKQIKKLAKLSITTEQPESLIQTEVSKTKKLKGEEVTNQNENEKSDAPIRPQTSKLSQKKKMERKKLFEQKRLERRKELGIMLLPKNFESRLLRIRKALKKKNLPAEEIKSIMRRERSKAQDEFRKSHSSQIICFNCRQPGHPVAKCPLNAENKDASICIKCGSTEHKYALCKKKITGFPFASCFICKGKGHISRDCPYNEHGIYPKGGECKLCNSVNHLGKDCPTLKKKKESFTLPTIDNGTSIDDEVMDVGEEIEKEIKSVEPKVVTF